MQNFEKPPALAGGGVTMHASLLVSDREHDFEIFAIAHSGTGFIAIACLDETGHPCELPRLTESEALTLADMLTAAATELGAAGDSWDAPTDPSHGGKS
jgi:hypothetical protein